MKGFAVALVAATSLAGCLGGSSVPPRAHYVLHDQATTKSAEPAAPGKQSLVVTGSAVDAFYDTESLVFSRKAGERSYYQFASWTDRPAHLVVRLAERRLEARGRFASVANLTTGVRADLVLNISVGEFYHDATVAPSAVRVELVGELVDWRTRSLLGRSRFTASAAVKTDDARGAADAFDHAVTETLDSLVPWVEMQAAKADASSG
jgi:ABC-type uncharacterized transport system auxiliary subunit